MGDTLIHERVAALRRDDNPTVVARTPSGWAVLGDHQFLPGYALLLPDPVVPSLNDLTGATRARFLLDMAALGDALLDVTDALRINYAIHGNHDPALHAHVWARYAWEPDAYRTGPVWRYPEDERASAPFDPERHGILRVRLRQALERRLAESGVEGETGGET